MGIAMVAVVKVELTHTSADQLILLQVLFAILREYEELKRTDIIKAQARNQMREKTQKFLEVRLTSGTHSSATR